MSQMDSNSMDFHDSQMYIQPSGTVNPESLITNNSQVGQISENVTQDNFSKLLSELTSIKSENASNSRLVHDKLDRLNEQQCSFNQKIEQEVTSNSSTIRTLKRKVEDQERKIQALENENDRLYRSVNFQNLVITGLPETANETDEQLRYELSQLFSAITECHINFDTAHRFQTKSNRNTFSRPIRVRFISFSDRNKVYESKEYLPENIFINEDLPFRVRQDNHAIRKKRAELFSENIPHTVDWKNKTIITETGIKYEINNGIVCIPLQQNEEFETTTINSNKSNHEEPLTSATSANCAPEKDNTNASCTSSPPHEPPKKRGRKEPDPNFLGVGSLRSHAKALIPAMEQQTNRRMLTPRGRGGTFPRGMSQRGNGLAVIRQPIMIPRGDGQGDPGQQHMDQGHQRMAFRGTNRGTNRGTGHRGIPSRGTNQRGTYQRGRPSYGQFPNNQNIHFSQGY